MNLLTDEVLRSQIRLCHERGVRPMPVLPGATVRIAGDVGGGKRPVHGQRQRPVGGFSGWYFWTGVSPVDRNQFADWSLETLGNTCPLVARFLSLTPGHRLLAYGTYSDVWADPRVAIGPPVREI